MPTILYSMGLPVPKGLDGKVRDEILIKRFVDSNPIIYKDIETVISKDEIGKLSSTEEQQIRERLKGLGYID